MDLQPSADALLEKLAAHAPLGDLGIVRQGIAENPAAIDARTNARCGNRFVIGQGVFVLQPEEVRALELTRAEQALLRPYHELADLGRYHVAETPSRMLIYSTKDTWPELDRFPRLREHLEPFREILDARRETRLGRIGWWHLHWPRDERLWQAAKIVAVQMARRPTFALARHAVYVSFSVNVFVPHATTHESLEYITGVLNSRLMWKWYQHHAKRRRGGPGN